ncbi:hypothetical protein EVG20_g2559 [Dentipellis fragilis]|uniref:Uncharacterized protein n=1 Tax=Dentipellis fragilis TaxID=205917 RepID=A0A4Y9Z9D0_9AGAM|nr:hypothetical protein EVG20_g2559 [Dentipellis fragilis]
MQHLPVVLETNVDAGIVLIWGPYLEQVFPISSDDSPREIQVAKVLYERGTIDFIDFDTVCHCYRNVDHPSHRPTYRIQNKLSAREVWDLVVKDPRFQVERKQRSIKKWRYDVHVSATAEDDAAPTET